MTLLLIPLSITLIFLFYTLYQRLRFKLPPGPSPKPIVGNLYDVKPVRFRCYAEWAQQYGPIISVWFGSILNVVVSNSELAKEVLKEKDQQLADRHRSRSAAKFSRDGQDLIWADYGPHYVKVRKVCTLELFSPKRLEALRPIREDEVTAMVESIFTDCTHPDKIGKSLLVKSYLGAVAFNNITRLAFGKRFVNSEGVIDEQGKEFKAIVANGLKLGGSLAMAEHIPWLRWFFPLEEEAFAKHGERRDRLTRAIMEEHTAARLKSGGTKQHFVDALLTLQKQYDLSDDTVIGLLWDMITAGMDTTAISVEWAMAELIKNPRVQQKAQEELDNVIGYERVLTEPDFSNLPYLQCVAKEALRLHPPTPLMLPHKANTNVKVGGYDIPKGSNVHVNVWAVARDPATWKNTPEFYEMIDEEEDENIRPLKRKKRPAAPGGSHEDFLKNLSPEDILAQLSQEAIMKTLRNLNLTPPNVPNATTGLFIESPEHGIFFSDAHGHLAFQRTAELGIAPHMHLYTLYRICIAVKELSKGYERYVIEEGDKRKLDVTAAPTFEVKQEAVDLIDS